MTVLNEIYANLEDLKENLNLEGIDPKRALVQVFSGVAVKSNIEQIQSIFKEKNSQVEFVGTTTAGEIFDGDVSEHCIVVSIVKFKNTQVKYGYFVDEDDYTSGVKLAQKLFSPTTKATILFADGLNINGSDLIDGIASVNPNMPISGGMAGDNGNFKETFVFNSTNIISKGVVAASLNSKLLNVFVDYHLNWQPIGKVMTVTKVEKNRLYELDGKNISDIYKDYLGERIGGNLPYSATEFPLIKLQDDELEICRTFTHKFEDGSLLTIGNLEMGDKVRFSFGNVDLALNYTKTSINKYKDYDAGAIFVYSCTARQAFLQSAIELELKPLKGFAPSCGFFTYGEFFHGDKKNALLNLSTTLLMLSEKSGVASTITKHDLLDDILSEYEDKNFITNKHFLVLDALTHLSNKVISELEEANINLHKSDEKLRDRANRDYLTNLSNRRYLNEVGHKFLSAAKREASSIFVLVMDIDNFKTINDTYGHKMGDEVIKEMSILLKRCTRKSDVVARLGGDEFAILLPSIGKNDAIKTAEKIRLLIEKQHINIDDKDIHFTISIGLDGVDIQNDVDISQALDRADIALYKAKNSGRNKVVVS